MTREWSGERLKDFQTGDIDEVELLEAILFIGLDPGFPGCRPEDSTLDMFPTILQYGNSYAQFRMPDLESYKLDIMNLCASYLCSGAFRLMVTTRPEKHLVLDRDGFVHIFWDFHGEIGSSLDIYKNHFFWDRGGDASR